MNYWSKVVKLFKECFESNNAKWRNIEVTQVWETMTPKRNLGLFSWLTWGTRRSIGREPFLVPGKWFLLPCSENYTLWKRDSLWRGSYWSSYFFSSPFVAHCVGSQLCPWINFEKFETKILINMTVCESLNKDGPWRRITAPVLKKNRF